MVVVVKVEYRSISVREIVDNWSGNIVAVKKYLERGEQSSFFSQ